MRLLTLVLCTLALFSMPHTQAGIFEAPKPRLSMFLGLDVSGSFTNSKYYHDSIDFVSHYVYAHLNSLGGLETPSSFFVGSLGGVKPGEPKTFYPIQVFQNKSVDEIKAKLVELFPEGKSNPITDYNAFFQHVADMVKDKKLILKPISIVMITDGKPDIPGKSAGDKFRKLDLKPLENLSRNVILRVLYTDAVTGGYWQNNVPRKRVKIWTQDAEVMVTWKDSKIFQIGKPFDKQDRFFNWVIDNVDFGVRAKRVD